jgi:hypothetical protein
MPPDPTAWMQRWGIGDAGERMLYRLGGSLSGIKTCSYEYDNIVIEF